MREFSQLICEDTRKVHIREFGLSTAASVLVSGVFVRVTTTPCHLGGSRLWFLCPSCERRCAILYPRHCRICRNGRYRVETMSLEDRLLTKAMKTREGLGQKQGGICVPFPVKPKRMRWHTYLRIRKAALALERRIWRNAASRLGL